MMDKCIEIKMHVFIQDKSHMTKVYLTSFQYLGFPCKGQGHFSKNKENVLNLKAANKL